MTEQPIGQASVGSCRAPESGPAAILHRRLRLRTVLIIGAGALIIGGGISFNATRQPATKGSGCGGVALLAGLYSGYILRGGRLRILSW